MPALTADRCCEQGLDEYTEAFVSQGFETLASLRSAALTDAELRAIGVQKLRHRKAILSLVSQEGYLKESDLNRLFHTAQQSRVAREQLQLVRCGELEHWLAPERQVRRSMHQDCLLKPRNSVFYPFFTHFPPFFAHFLRLDARNPENTARSPGENGEKSRKIGEDGGN
eukprot:COSAG04_NODE_170_length_21634_cov_12.250337_9_plen_169_part_00